MHHAQHEARHATVPTREGDGTVSRGLISPSRRIFSTAPAGLILWCLRVSPKSFSAHQCPASGCGQKDHPRTPGGGLPEVLRPTRRPVRQRTGSHRRAATRKTTGGYPAIKGTDPGTELNGEWCRAAATSGLHQSWWTVVTRTAWEPPALRAALWVSTRQSWRLLDGLLPLRRRANASAGSFSCLTE